MSVIWSGITEEGAVVPVQVTAEGKVVAVGDGPQGDYLPITGGELTGPLTSTAGAEFTKNVRIGTTKNIWLAASGNTSIGTLSLGSDTAAGFLLVPQGLQYVQRPAASPNEDVYSAYKGQVKTINFTCDGEALFSGDVVIGSRGSKWLIRESNGVAMLIEQTLRGQIEERLFEKVRDLPNELDLIEAALSEVMSKLEMVPPTGWPVS